MVTKWCAIDIETTGLNFREDSILGVGIYCDSIKRYYDFNKTQDVLSQYGHAYTSYPDRLQLTVDLSRLVSAGYKFTLQNCGFDWKFLKYNGIDISCDFDTMIAAYVNKDRPKSLALDSLAAYYLGIPSWKGDFKSGEAHRDPEVMAAYCLKDCEVTLELTVQLEGRLMEQGRLEFFEKLMKARRILNDAELTGMLVDKHKLESLIIQLDPEIKQLERELEGLAADHVSAWVDGEIATKLDSAGPLHSRKRQLALERLGRNPPKFNWASPKQILWLLKRLGVDVVHPLTKKESSDAKVLERAAHLPIVGKLLEIRERVKLLSALDNESKASSGGYKQLIQSDGRIHGSFNLAVTETGRLSSSKPNMQNIDKSARVRGLFVAPEGYKLVVADLAQIEVRVAAHYSKDPLLMSTFTEGHDFYGIIAVNILGATCKPNEVKTLQPKLRAIAKVIGLSILYGTGPNRLRNEIKRGTGTDVGFDGAKQIIDDYFRKFPGLKELQRGVTRTIEDRGYVVNLMGRHVDVEGDDGFRFGVNYLFQSSASDLLLLRQAEIIQHCKDYSIDARLLALVHDEMVYECRTSDAPRLAEIMKTTMEQTADIKFRVPLKIEVSIGDDWSCK